MKNNKRIEKENESFKNFSSVVKKDEIKTDVGNVLLDSEDI